MQGKISNIYRKNNFQDRNTIPKVYLHLSILQHNRMFILTNKLSEKLETLGNVSQHFSSEKDPSKILSDIHTILLCVASQQTTLECKKKKIALTLTKCSNGHCCGSVVQIFLRCKQTVISQGHCRFKSNWILSKNDIKYEFLDNSHKLVSVHLFQIQLFLK